jgi:hypothetical protein
MAQRVPRPELDDDEIPIDPAAIEVAYRRERARRRARERRLQERSLAGVRFYAALFVLLCGAVALFVLIWQEIQRLFGL